MGGLVNALPVLDLKWSIFRFTALIWTSQSNISNKLKVVKPLSWGSCYTPALRCSWWYGTLPPARSSVRRCSRSPECIRTSDKTHPWRQPFLSAWASVHWADTRKDGNEERVQHSMIYFQNIKTNTAVKLYSRCRCRLSHFSLGVEYETLVQGVGDTFDELLPNTVLQKLLWIHLKQTRS